MTDPSLNQSPKSSTGLEDNLAGLLCYVLGFITGILFLLIEKNSKFVRFHAAQSIVVFGGLVILNRLLIFVPVFGWLISILLGPLGFVLWIVLMIKAYQGQMFRIPFVSDLSENLLNRTKS